MNYSNIILINETNNIIEEKNEIKPKYNINFNFTKINKQNNNKSAGFKYRYLAE